MFGEHSYELTLVDRVGLLHIFYSRLLRVKNRSYFFAHANRKRHFVTMGDFLQIAVCVISQFNFVTPLAANVV